MSKKKSDEIKPEKIPIESNPKEYHKLRKKKNNIYIKKLKKKKQEIKKLKTNKCKKRRWVQYKKVIKIMMN